MLTVLNMNLQQMCQTLQVDESVMLALLKSAMAGQAETAQLHYRKAGDLKPKFDRSLPKRQKEEEYQAPKFERPKAQYSNADYSTLYQ